MANTRILRWVPNATYIPLTGVGGWHRGQHKFKGVCWLQDTNMLVSPMQNSGVGGIGQRQPPTPGILRRSGI